MTDPNGALAFQRKGDFAWFDGAQWQSSNRGQNISPGTGSGQVILSEGSSAVPATSNTLSTLMVSRYSAMTAADSANVAAITAINTDRGNLTQAVGIHTEATQVGIGDACSVLAYGTVTAAASVSGGGHYPVAFGVFGYGANYFPGGDVNGVNPVVSLVSSRAAGTVSAGVFVQTLAINTQTATVTFQATSPGKVNWTAHGFSVGHSVKFSGGTLPVALTANQIYFVQSVVDTDHFTVSATFGGGAINFAGTGSGTITGVAYVMTGAGVTIENATPTNSIFDEGYRAEAGTVRNAFLSDQSSAVIGYKDAGTHTIGIDQSAASISSYAAYLKGTNGAVALDNQSAGEQALLYFHDAGTQKWLLGKQTDNSFILFDVAGSIEQFGVLTGTPGANKTNIYFAQGAGPTLRQVATFNDGTHDVLYLI